MARKKTATSVANEQSQLVPITDTALVPSLGSEEALAKMPGTGGLIAREQGVVLVKGRPYRTDDQLVPAAEIYFDDSARPRGDGPWLHEADKVAWRDPATGYECIMLRNRDGGFLSGYVGVPVDHPLWGWEREAVPSDLGIEVHGGLTYSRICEHGPSPDRRLATEARRICDTRMTPADWAPLRHGSDHRVEDADAWWFGFDCNHIYDVVPNARAIEKRFLSAETAAVYRDDAYVVREVTNLAAQLRAVATGEPTPPRRGPPLPPIGLDPKRGG